MIANALDYCRRFIYFWQSSPIMGRFDDSKYPLIVAPLLSLDDIRIKCTVIIGPTQSLKTVALQCATAYRLDIIRKSMLAVAQTDDDAKDFAIVKLKPFLERIPTLRNTVKKGTYSITNDLWQWANHELIISGPGDNAQQSKSACFLHTDEAHRYNKDNPGAMAALQDRMGTRWDRHELHCTTAPDEGMEVDTLFQAGQQNEWHVMCNRCFKLFIPLWEIASRDRYNGHKVFNWIESDSETETLNSITMYCPHCDKPIYDTPINRREMDEGAMYIPDNPDADVMYQSFRWNCFALRWKPWRDLFAIYLNAIKIAKLGDFTPYKNWVTKHEARVWRNEFPMLGDSKSGRDYSRSEIYFNEDNLPVCSFDIQEEGGFHIWAQADLFEKDGSSRRMTYTKLQSWADARKFQIDHSVRDCNVGVDFGHRDREVFGQCANYHWYALKSGDEETFAHVISILDPKTKRIITKIIQLPYSEVRLENPMSGKETKRVRLRGRQIPFGFCGSRLWSKPVLYGILYSHKSGDAGRYYGIASDIGEEYTKQLHSYIPALDIDKKTNTTRKRIWRKISNMDHSFVTSCQNILMAMIAGYFPMSEAMEENK